MFQEIIDTFLAFNINAFSSLAYIFMTSWWFLLIAFGAVLSMVMMLRDEIDSIVKDEQQVL